MKALLAAHTDSKGVVFVPSAAGQYVVHNSIYIDGDGIEVVGEGWGTIVKSAGGTSHPIFLLGIYRTVPATIPLTLDATNRPDAFGKLDASAAAGPTVKYGLRTKGNTFGQFYATPLSAGVISPMGGYPYSDNWTETTKLTLEFLIDPPAGGFPAGGTSLLGVGDVQDPAPFVLQMNDSTTVAIVFRVAGDEPGTNHLLRVGQFSLAGHSPPYGIAVQFDLDTPAITTFVNGTQVAIFTSVNFPTVPNSGPFIANDHHPFMLGSVGALGYNDGSTHDDLTFYGLRLSNAIRYRNDGAGQPQRRVDSPGTPVNDLYRYFTRDANTIAHLTMTDLPTADRLITVMNGAAANDGITGGLFLHTTYSPIKGNAIRNMQLIGNNSHAQLISVGAILDLELTDLKILSCYQAIGQFLIAANYPILLSRCTLSGADCAYFGAMTGVSADHIEVAQCGRCAIRMLGGGGHWDHVFVAFGGNTTANVFKQRSFEYGGDCYISHMGVDFEGAELLGGGAAIHYEACVSAPSPTLHLENIQLGTVGRNNPVVRLKDAGVLGGTLHRAYLNINNLAIYSLVYKSVIEVDGPLWHGDVTGLGHDGPPFYHEQLWGTKTNVVMHETRFVGPPREYLWYEGAHHLDVRNPADGQYTEWRCVATGTYGTATPPTWQGLTPLAVAPNAIAGYMTNCGYMTGALS